MNYKIPPAVKSSRYRELLARNCGAKIRLLFALISGAGCGAGNVRYSPVSLNRNCRSNMQEESIGRRELASARPTGSSRIVTASWYGPGYDGHRTSSGERFNGKRRSAASSTLPLGTMVRVTNLDTGRSTIVKINDRGPRVGGRGLDLSPAAAQEIGLKKQSVGRVSHAGREIEGARYSRPPHLSVKSALG